MFYRQAEALRAAASGRQLLFDLLLICLIVVNCSMRWTHNNLPMLPVIIMQFTKYFIVNVKYYYTPKTALMFDDTS